jgi:hypothetical protein
LSASIASSVFPMPPIPSSRSLACRPLLRHPMTRRLGLRWHMTGHLKCFIRRNCSTFSFIPASRAHMNFLLRGRKLLSRTHHRFLLDSRRDDSVRQLQSELLINLLKTLRRVASVFCSLLLTKALKIMPSFLKHFVTVALILYH